MLLENNHMALEDLVIQIILCHLYGVYMVVCSFGNLNNLNNDTVFVFGWYTVCRAIYHSKAGFFNVL